MAFNIQPSLDGKSDAASGEASIPGALFKPASRGAARVRLGDVLIERGLITSQTLAQALQEQKLTGLRLGAQLVEMGAVAEDDLLQALSDHLGIALFDLKDFTFEPRVVRLLPESISRRFRIVALQEDGDALVVGMSDPTDLLALDEIQKIVATPIRSAMVREAELLELLDRAYGQGSEIANLAGQIEAEIRRDAYADEDDSANDPSNDAPVVRLLQEILQEALATKASDIHIEPDDGVLRIRKRVDGRLVERTVRESRIAGALVVRLKLMANLNISERRLPQDGRFHFTLGERRVDVRISTMPVQFGESVVMRVLDHSHGLRSLEQIGMPAALTAQLRSAIHRPHGLVIVTGPTGSGKTTTLYSALTELNRPETKIITVEDPVEYRLPRVNQVQLHEQIGLSFATVLKAALRQDPDILLVGEIRDAESAEIALRAALTGHLVLSTLHTNDAVSTPLRLVDMNVDPYLIASSVRAIVAQRLIRRVCDSCAEPHHLSPEDLAGLRSLAGDEGIPLTGFRRGAGCSHCFDAGYRGRIGIFELLEFDAAMADALRRNDPQHFYEVAGKQKSFRSLASCALDLARQGITSLDEVISITSDEKFPGFEQG